MTTKKKEPKPKQQFDVEKILTNLAGLTALIEGQKIRISKLKLKKMGIAFRKKKRRR